MITTADYWTYKSSFPTPDLADLPPGTFSGTQEEWTSLSPGMRREIARQATSRRTREG